MRKLRALWTGDLPLGEAFWVYAVSIGLTVNVTTSLLFLALIAADRPLAALFVGYVCSVPYNVVAVVGVWRARRGTRASGRMPSSPGRHAGRHDPAVADLSRSGAKRSSSCSSRTRVCAAWSTSARPRAASAFVASPQAPEGCRSWACQASFAGPVGDSRR